MSQSSPSVDRVVSVLNFFAEHPGQAFSFTDIVRSLKLGRATCHALLTSLVDARYLFRNSDKSYVIGPALVELGQIAKEHFSPLQAAQSEMRDIADEFDAICSAVFLEQGFAIVKSRATAASHLAWSIPQGKKMPLRPPFGAIFYVGSESSEIENWMDELQPPPTPEQRKRMLDGVKFTQEFGFSFGTRNFGIVTDKAAPELAFSGEKEYPVALLSEINEQEEYNVAFLSAAVFDKNSRVAFALVITGFTHPLPGSNVLQMGLRLRGSCDNLTNFLYGRKPEDL